MYNETNSSAKREGGPNSLFAISRRRTRWLLRLVNVLTIHGERGPGVADSAVPRSVVVQATATANVQSLHNSDPTRPWNKEQSSRRKEVNDSNSSKPGIILPRAGTHS
jgi:hypothetical protein